MGTALAIYDRVQNPLAFASEMAESTAAIVGCSLAQGKGIALTCLCEGLTPVEFKRRYHWIPTLGPAMRADAMRAEFRMNYGGDFEIVENTPDRAAIKFLDKKGRELVSEVTWEKAQGEPWPWAKGCGPGTQKTQPIWENLKDSWATPLSRANMLIARATSRGLRLLCPELVAGIYTPEEMQDLDVMQTAIVTDQPRRTTAAEAMALAADQTNGAAAVVEEPPFEAADDAEFVPVTDSGAPAVQSFNGYATRAQIDRLHELRTELNMPQSAWEAALKKRNATTAHGLKAADAQDLIDKLEAKRRLAVGAAKN